MKFEVHEGAETWTPSLHEWSLLQKEFPGDSYQVEIYPRSEIPSVLKRSFPPYKFRAVTRPNGVSYVFVDDSETRESIAWLIAHELAHRELQLKPEMARFFLQSRGSMDPAGDEFHRLDREELHCDEVATKLFGKRLDRAWWRHRLEQAKR